jgi:hypothetical protein
MPRTDNEPNASPDEYMKALHGLDFPAPKDAVVRKARDKGGFDTEVHVILSELPDRAYTSMDDVIEEVKHTLAERGGLGDGGPAAPSRETTKDKGRIETAADPRRGESH